MGKSATPRNLNQYYAKDQGISGIERFWRLFCYWRKAGYCVFAYPVMVYLYFLSYHGISGGCVYDPRFLDQYQELYIGGEEKPNT